MESIKFNEYDMTTLILREHLIVNIFKYVEAQYLSMYMKNCNFELNTVNFLSRINQKLDGSIIVKCHYENEHYC